MKNAGIINNPWIVGVGGSIISGLIVYFLTEFFGRKKLNRKLQETIQLANAEIVYAIRPLIVAKVIPQFDVLKALISATSKKYGLPEDSVINIHDVSNQIIKEILDNSFLTAEDKISYSNMILPMGTNEDLLSTYKDKFAILEAAKIKNYDSSKVPEVAFSLGITAAIISGILPFLSKSWLSKLVVEHSASSTTGLIYSIAIITALMAMIGILLSTSKKLKSINKTLDEKLKKRGFKSDLTD